MSKESMKVLDDGKVYKVQKLRQRKIHSCVHCHSKKIKCSRDHPTCSNCSKTDTPCKYFINERVSRGKKKTIQDVKTPPSDNISMSVSNSPISDHMVNPLSPASTPPESFMTISNSSNINSLFSNEFDNDLSNYQASGAFTTFNTPNINLNTKSNPNSNSFSSFNSINDNYDSKFNESNERHKFIPNNKHSNFHFSNNERYQSFSNEITNDQFQLNDSVLPNTLLNSNTLLSYLPSKERSTELINRYINSVHILLPLLDISNFLQLHKAYHSSPTQQLDKHFEFLLILFPILYGSTISEFEEYDNLLLKAEITKYYTGFQIMNQIYNYPNNTSFTLLQANLIVQSTSFNPSPLVMGSIIRYAQNLKLDRDPVSHHKITNFDEIRLKRLVWWQIFSLDSLSSLNFCVVPQLRVKEFDVLQPDEYTKGELDYSIVCINANFSYSIILNEIVHQLNGFETIDEEKVNEIKGEIVKLYNIIKVSLKRVNESVTSNKQMNFIQFVKDYMGSFVDRALLLFHKKILMSTDEPIQNESKLISNLVLSKTADSQIPKNYRYDELSTNLLPSILHNLNDFITYNDFIKFGKFNWYIKRTIPVDSIICLFIIIAVKFKNGVLSPQELNLYNNLINKSLFILNKNWFKSEKYKRMLSLVNCMWKYICGIYQVEKVLASCGYLILNPLEIGVEMIVPKPTVSVELENYENGENCLFLYSDTNGEMGEKMTLSNNELSLMREKINYNLDNNFVNEMDYCEVFCHLERILKNLLNFLDNN